MPRKKQEPPLITLSIYRLRPAHGRLDEILVDNAALQPTPLTKVRGFDRAVIVTKPTHLDAPRWHAFLIDHLPSGVRLPQSKSSNALLILWRKKRVYALSFGTGRFFLNPAVIDDTFGLKTCLNSIDRDQIRTIDSENFEAVHRHTREQAGSATSIAGFGMNLDEDLLRAVTGTPKDPALGKVLSGREVLHATINITLDDLAPVIDAYEQRANSKDYQKDFGWADHIQPVPPARQDTLNEELVERLQHGDTDRTWLVIPQLLLREDILGFRYNKKPDDPFPNLHLNDYFATVRHAVDVSLEALKRDKVGVYAADPQPMLEWAVYKGLYAEHDDEQTTYLLTNGHWYAISRDFVTRIDAALKRVRDADITLPDYEGPNEGAYNETLAKTPSPKKVLFDKRMFQSVGATSPFELCDVYTADQAVPPHQEVRGLEHPEPPLRASPRRGRNLLRRRSHQGGIQRHLAESTPTQSRRATSAKRVPDRSGNHQPVCEQRHSPLLQPRHTPTNQPGTTTHRIRRPPRLHRRQDSRH